jgi:1-deoxy-D-xylulose-5-phosphate synthase
MLEEAQQIAAKLSEHGITAGVVNARFAKPLDTDALLESAQSSKLIVTLEDHVIQGGFGSAVLEALDEAKSPCPLLRLGWPDAFIEHGSSVQSLRQQHGLNTEQLFQQVLQRALETPGLEPESVNDNSLS